MGRATGLTMIPMASPNMYGQVHGDALTRADRRRSPYPDRLGRVGRWRGGAVGGRAARGLAGLPWTGAASAGHAAGRGPDSRRPRQATGRSAAAGQPALRHTHLVLALG